MLFVRYLALSARTRGTARQADSFTFFLPHLVHSMITRFSDEFLPKEGICCSLMPLVRILVFAMKPQSVCYVSNFERHGGRFELHIAKSRAADHQIAVVDTKPFHLMKTVFGLGTRSDVSDSKGYDAGTSLHCFDTSCKVRITFC